MDNYKNCESKKEKKKIDSILKNPKPMNNSLNTTILGTIIYNFSTEISLVILEYITKRRYINIEFSVGIKCNIFESETIW